jgi:hypothetical protein
MQLKPTWVPVENMPDEWKDGRPLLVWMQPYPGYRRNWGEYSYHYTGFKVPKGRVVTHVSADTICGPDEEMQQ